MCPQFALFSKILSHPSAIHVMCKTNLHLWFDPTWSCDEVRHLLTHDVTIV
jgi:hypothetical protein